MRKRNSNLRILLLLLIVAFVVVYLLNEKHHFIEGMLESQQSEVIKYDNTSKTNWDESFKVVEIVSPEDGEVQNAYFYKSSSNEAQPLIVSLHTWSGDYTQYDTIAFMAKTNDLNYIHPNFRGQNWTFNACCSHLALTDIDASIDYAIKHANVDMSQIYVIGASGGGFATLSMFMKSRHQVRKFSAWVPISDVVAWYDQCNVRQNKYAGDIIKCTSLASDSLDVNEAIKRSPIYWETPIKKLDNSRLEIFAGVYDGIQGSVPITQSINFYNKILSDIGIADEGSYVSESEKLSLLEFRKPIADYGKIGDRDVCLNKEYNNIRLTIFMGNHEMLPGYAFTNLLE